MFYMSRRKDDFIGIRISKELKQEFQKEAKKQGVTLSEYFESCVKGQFWESKFAVQSMIAEAQEKNPEFWKKAKKMGLVRELEHQIPMFVSDFVMPQSKQPDAIPLHMGYLIWDLVRALVNNIDGVPDFYKGATSSQILEIGKSIADNVSKLKSKEKEEQKKIIEDLKEIIETFVFGFTSMAFAKDSFLKINAELEKTKTILLNELKKNESDNH
jgi:hypothetical protein